MHMSTFLGRRVQALISFIRFSKEFVDPRRFRTTGVTGVAQRWFFRGPADSSSVMRRTGLHGFYKLFQL